MATIVLSAVGAAAGASIGGGVMGLSSVIIGRALGAAAGRALDQRLLGAGSQAVEQGKVDRFWLTGASEGAAIGQVYGRMRIGGQVIWATRFHEHRAVTGGSGKGAAAGPRVAEYSYSVSLAIALCEGEISRIGRIWADGQEIAPADLAMRVYCGSADQMPDPRIEAVEGAGHAPAYRGTAYVVFEDLDLAPFGNRVPQFSFEVFRPAPAGSDGLAQGVQAVALIPGTGEYALATRKVYYNEGPGQARAANIAAASGISDFATSLEALTGELPNCGSTALVVSWFGNDLRCGSCQVQPKVEQRGVDSDQMPWRAGGVARADAAEVPRDGTGASVYGGTPADGSVIEAIRALRDAGQAVMFYPFILMDQMAGNDLPDPYGGGAGQPVFPWRGRITTSLAPGVAGSPDGTAAADAEVAAFFGAASVGDFTVVGGDLHYSGPAEWSLRRMILHYAHLCALAGGVDAFCISSEMRGLTQIRGAAGFPAVAALRALAADVRAILGAECKISYAADWSEYFGYQPVGTGDLIYHLDPLWADENIDFIGIDNYMPLSDWRDGADHADAGWGAIYDLEYLRANIEGGEGYDWYYAAPEHREAQIRTPIADGAHGEDWIWRYKDIRNWWLSEHRDRIGGVRAEPTEWVPQSKPVWFTELGCAAIDKGTNEPNKFLDPKSSESALPHHSSGQRDDFIQMQYLRAMFGYWGDPARNPVSELYGGPMIDMGRAHVWAWDARPWPAFPGNAALWSDGANYARGHWLNGRASARALADVVAEICAQAGLGDDLVDVRGLHGVVRGYRVGDTTSARAALQPLMLAYGFEAVERGGKIVFHMRNGVAQRVLDPEHLAISNGQDSALEHIRAPEAEIAGRVQLSFVEVDGDYGVTTAEAVFPDDAAVSLAQSELPLALTLAEGRAITQRWLAEARVARDSLRFALPPSQMAAGAGDVVAVGGGHYRIDRLTQAGAAMVEAVRVEPGIYQPTDGVDDLPALRPFAPPVPVYPLFLDLPLLRGDEIPHAPHVAAVAQPWPGSVAVYAAPGDAGYALNRLLPAPAMMGITQTPLAAAGAGLWDRGAPLRVRMAYGALAGAEMDAVLSGANLAAIGDGTAAHWEMFQFARAELVGDGIYDLSLRLRGLAGSDALAGAWPAGSHVVLLDGAAQQIDLAPAARGLARHYRIGPAGRPYDDPIFAHRTLAFDGIGLRPYAPVHLRATRLASGDLAIRWIRRTRIGGDSWQLPDAPLGEAYEAYVLRVIAGGEIRREVSLQTPGWTYPQALQTADGIGGGCVIEVAQISELFGPGLVKRIEING